MGTTDDMEKSVGVDTGETFSLDGPVEFSPVSWANSWQLTNDLRYVLPPHTTTEPPRLQRKWIHLEDGRTEWEDVPLVVVDE